MTTTPPKRRPTGSLAERIRDHFESDPSDALTLDDMAMMFGHPKSTVRQTVHMLKRSGFGLESVHLIRMRAAAPEPGKEGQ